MVFGQEIESPSDGVPGETFPRRTCAAMYRGKILGVDISSSEHLVLLYSQGVVSTPEDSFLKTAKKS